MTKTVSDLKKEYPEELLSGLTEEANVNFNPLKLEDLKEGYHLIGECHVRYLPKEALKHTNNNLKLLLPKNDENIVAKMIKPNKSR